MVSRMGVICCASLRKSCKEVTWLNPMETIHLNAKAYETPTIMARLLALDGLLGIIVLTPSLYQVS